MDRFVLYKSKQLKMCMNEWIDKLMVDEWMDGWIDGQTDGRQIDSWMDGWTN